MPPDTSKWNNMDHRLFSFTSVNWRGQPLTTDRVIVELIAATMSRTGLRVQAYLTRAPTRSNKRSPTPSSPPCR
jgi:hypothetical protein